MLSDPHQSCVQELSYQPAEGGLLSYSYGGSRNSFNLCNDLKQEKGQMYKIQKKA